MHWEFSGAALNPFQSEWASITLFMSGVIEVNKQTAYNIAKISKMTWYRHNQGYFFNHITTGGKRFVVMRHVLNFYIAHGWIPDFVDHIDKIWNPVVG